VTRGERRPHSSTEQPQTVALVTIDPHPTFSQQHINSRIRMMSFYSRWVCLPLLLLLLVMTTTIRSEQYTFDFANVHRPVVSSGSQPLISRMIQATNNPDPCYYEGPFLVCVYSFATGSAGNETMITFMARCDINSLYAFDYRQATNCACIAQVTTVNKAMKECPCTVCAAGFGDIPISVDCSVHDQNTNNTTTEGSSSEDLSTTTATESGTAVVSAVEQPMVDPYIFNTCTSIDCSGACNGTCAVNCDASGSLCSYCVGTPNLPSTNPIPFPSAPLTSGTTSSPGELPSSFPSANPTSLPSSLPSVLPSSNPTSLPSSLPSVLPSTNPTSLPSSRPSFLPSTNPSLLPAAAPTRQSNGDSVSLGAETKSSARTHATPTRIGTILKATVAVALVSTTIFM
jgi:hypothetical protein